MLHYVGEYIPHQSTDLAERAAFVQEMSEVQASSDWTCPHGPPAPFEFPQTRKAKRARR